MVVDELVVAKSTSIGGLYISLLRDNIVRCLLMLPAILVHRLGLPERINVEKETMKVFAFFAHLNDVYRLF